jgi:large subunit ribosomal protein L20
LWIVRINAACRMRGLRYSALINALQKARVELNRQTLAEIAIHDPPAFDKIVELAKQHV